MTTCGQHPFGSDWGATCINAEGHAGAHMYRSAWAPDRHTEEFSDD